MKSIYLLYIFLGFKSKDEINQLSLVFNSNIKADK